MHSAKCRGGWQLFGSRAFCEVRLKPSLLFSSQPRRAFAALGDIPNSRHQNDYIHEEPKPQNQSQLVEKLSSMRLPGQVLQFYVQHQENLSPNDSPRFLRKLVEFTTHRSLAPQHEADTSVQLVKMEPPSQVHKSSSTSLCKKITTDQRFWLLINTTTQHLNSFTPEELVDLLHLLGKLHWSDAQFYDIVASFLVKEIPTLKLTTLIKCLGAVAHCCSDPRQRHHIDRTQLRYCIHVIFDVLASRAHELTPDQLALTVALVTPVCGKSNNILKVLIPLVEARTRQFTPHQLAILVSGLSRRNAFCNDTTITTSLILRALALDAKSWSTATPRDLASLLQGAARASEPPATLFEKCEEAVVKLLPESTDRDLGIFLWSYQHSSSIHPRFWTTILAELQSRLSRLTYRTTVVALTALASLFNQQNSLVDQQSFDKFFNDCEEIIVRSAPDNQKSVSGALTPSDCATTLWAYHQAALGSLTLYDSLGSRLVPVLGELRPEEFVRLLVSFGALRREMSQKLFPALVQETLERITHFSLAALCSVCWSFAAMGLKDPNTWKGFCIALDRFDVEEWTTNTTRQYPLYPAFMEIKRISSLTHYSPLLPDDVVNRFLNASREAFLDVQYNALQELTKSADGHLRALLQVKRALDHDASLHNLLRSRFEQENALGKLILLFPVDGLLVDLYIPRLNVAILLHTTRDAINRRAELPRASGIIKYQALRDVYGMSVINILPSDLHEAHGSLHTVILKRLKAFVASKSSLPKITVASSVIKLLHCPTYQQDPRRKRLLHSIRDLSGPPSDEPLQPVTSATASHCAFPKTAWPPPATGHETHQTAVYHVMAPTPALAAHKKKLQKYHDPRDCLSQIPSPFSPPRP